MSNFSAKVIADLDTSKIPSQLKDITKKHPLVLNNFTLNTKGLPSQIQAVLDNHKFTIHLGNIKGENIESQLSRLGGKASEAFASKINTKLGTGGIESAIASVTAKFEKLESTGHSKLSQIKKDIVELNVQHGKMKTAGDDITSLVDAYAKYEEALSRVRNNLTIVSAESNRVNTNKIESEIASVTAKFEKFGASGHSKLSAIQSDIEELTRLQKIMSNSATDTNTLNLAYSEYNQILSRVRQNLTVVAAETGKLASAMQVDQLNNKMDKWLNRNTAAAKTLGQSIQSLKSKLNSLYSSGELTEAELKEINQEFINLTVNAELAGKTGKKLGSTLVNSFKSILKYVSVSTIIYSLINAFKQMYNNVYNINTEMTELKKVTNETEATYDRFLDKAGKKAEKLGTTISELASSTADFARLGYDMEDAEDLAEVANIYNVVGDEIEDIDAATQSIISTMTAFKIEAKDAIQIVDKFNAVGKILPKCTVMCWEIILPVSNYIG